MTFLYDEEILQQISKFAQEAPQSDDIRALVTKLVSNISSDMEESIESSGISGDEAFSLQLSDLQKSPNDFLLYLESNKVKYNNDLIVTKYADKSSTKTTVMNGSEKIELYVDAEALIGLLDQLTEIAQTNRDKNIGSLLNNLRSGLKGIIKDTAAQAVNILHQDDFDPNAALANAPTKYNSNGSVSSEKPIAAKDLASKIAFNNWLKLNAVTFDGTYDNIYKDNNLGTILSYLVKMFYNIEHRATTKVIQHMGSHGKAAAEALARSFGVTLGDKGPAVNSVSETDSGDSGDSSMNYNNILSNLPFTADHISTGKFITFFNNLSKFDSSSAIGNSKARALNHFNKAKAKTISKLGEFPLHSSAAEAIYSDTFPASGNIQVKRKNAFEVLAHLQAGINETRMALEYFKRRHLKQLNQEGGSQYLNEINSQIGASAGSSSAYQSNMRGLQRTRAKLLAMAGQQSTTDQYRTKIR